MLVLRAPDADLLIVGQSLLPEQTALRFLLVVLVWLRTLGTSA